MCGRFALTANQLDIQRRFGADPHPTLAPLAPRYNVAPTQTVAVVGAKPGGRGRGLVRLRWGLVPNWSADAKTGPTNARSETVDRLPTFRESFRGRRCLLPMTGFYEWQTVGRKKVPHFFTLPDGELMAVAGIWDVWKGDDGQKLVTCCLLTTSANDTVRPLHDRMPVILPPETWDVWLAPDTPVAALLPLLKPYGGPMTARPANPLVNKVGNDGPECLQPLATVAAA